MSLGCVQCVWEHVRPHARPTSSCPEPPRVPSSLEAVRACSYAGTMGCDMPASSSHCAHLISVLYLLRPILYVVMEAC
jgi:hypothetical protein